MNKLYIIYMNIYDIYSPKIHPLLIFLIITLMLRRNKNQTCYQKEEGKHIVTVFLSFSYQKFLAHRASNAKFF